MARPTLSDPALLPCTCLGLSEPAFLGLGGVPTTFSNAARFEEIPEPSQTAARTLGEDLARVLVAGTKPLRGDTTGLDFCGGESELLLLSVVAVTSFTCVCGGMKE